HAHSVRYATRSGYTRAKQGLATAFLAARPGATLNASGSMSDWRDNLLPEIDEVWFKDDLEQGDGKELQGKFRAAHSSSALAVNSFARFRPDVASLSP